MDPKGMDSMRRLPSRAWAGGVCAGMAYWAGSPMWVVRGAWVLAAVLALPAAVVLYAVACMFMPKWSIEPPDFERRVGLVEPVAESKD